MAYGVKYRLEFSDVLGYPRKLEILKKDYTGAVLPMIGAKSPVTISWQSSNDFYSPIIGSKCQLNLLVTDNVQYDDFYKFDEREYKINVYYVEPISEVFENRVANDGGITEAINCVENETKYSLDSSGDIIKNYNLFWTGFLVVDRYKESITTPPFGIKLNAFDGLGTLSAYNGTTSPNYDGSTLSTSLTDIERISLILQNLDLDIDIHFVNDTFQRDGIIVGGVEYKKFPFIRTQIGANELKKDFDTYTAKEQLKIILSMYNQRIFQSFGKWYIVEATNIFDKTIKDEIQNELTNNLTILTGIRNKIKNQLLSTGGERYETYKFNYLGVLDSIKNIPYVSESPVNILPINKSLTREFLQPLKSVQINVTENDLKNYFFNSGFEYGLTGFDTPGNKVEITEDTAVFKGIKSLKIKDSVAPANSEILNLSTPTTIPSFGDISNHSFRYNYYHDFTENIPDTSLFQGYIAYLTLTYTSATSTETGQYTWDESEQSFKLISSGGVVINYIFDTEYNMFKSVDIKFSTDGLDERTDTIWTITDIKLEIKLRSTFATSSFYNSTYFDNFIIDNGETTSNVNRINFEMNLSDNNVNSGEKSFTKIGLTNNRNIARTRDNYFSFNPPANLKKGPHTVAMQNVANDFRSFVERFDGTFRNVLRKPMSISDRLWFNFQNSIKNEQPTIIDGLTFDVKENAYKIKCHLPNDDDDVSTQSIVR